MMYRKLIEDLYRHMEWADAIVWREVLCVPGARSDHKLTGLFHHLHLVQHAYLRAWRDEIWDGSFPTFDSADSISDWGRSFYSQFVDYLPRVSDEDLVQKFSMPWTEIVTKELGQTPAPITLGESMLQVPMHSHYHRGQINLLLRAAGGEPPKVDYVAWMWLGQPQAEWEPMQA
jgi:uncharacterized damage-inducible protein DinB